MQIDLLMMIVQLEIICSMAVLKLLDAPWCVDDIFLHPKFRTLKPEEVRIMISATTTTLTA